ncbi:MAG: hypothetical protein DRJ07_02640 [Bacteroidetes bacterium]|nr:MAG: hypothetical protein DRJ07_02640 [Bacteroidota bacterium]
MKKRKLFLVITLSIAIVSSITLIPKTAKAIMLKCYGSSTEVCFEYTAPDGQLHIFHGEDFVIQL